jgi:DNA-binding HxlR family transcriptional regulator
MLGPVPPTTLPARLDELAAAGLLKRRVVDSRPPRTEYELTEKGQHLSELLDNLAYVGARR